MESKYDFRLYDLSHTSLVLLKEVSDILSKIDNDFISINEHCQRVIEDNIIEENFKNGIVLVNEPASAEEFAYSIRKFKKNALLYFRKIFSYSYIITKNNQYKRVIDYIDIILEYRKHQLEDLFNETEKMANEDLEFYVQLIPKDTVDEMADYCEVVPKNLSVELLKQEYNKVKKIGRIKYE